MNKLTNKEHFQAIISGNEILDDMPMINIEAAINKPKIIARQNISRGFFSYWGDMNINNVLKVITYMNMDRFRCSKSGDGYVIMTSVRGI